MTASLLDRFWAKVQKTEGCWIWTGAISANGYGNFWDGTRQVSPHRWAYETFVGPIPEGLQIDHVRDRGCASRACVRPDHLEPVTGTENQARSPLTPSGKVACPQGHAYDEANTYVNRQGKRECRACHRDRARVRYHAQKGWAA